MCSVMADNPPFLDADLRLFLCAVEICNNNRQRNGLSQFYNLSPSGTNRGKGKSRNKTENDAHIVYKKNRKERIENEPLHHPKERRRSGNQGNAINTADISHESFKHFHNVAFQHHALPL